MKLKQKSKAIRNGEESAVYSGELWKGDFFVWLKNVFPWRKNKTDISFESEKNVFRLISQGTFFEEDYIDVWLDFLPKIGQKIKIKGIEGVYLVIRTSNQARELALLKAEEGLEYSSDYIAAEYLKEKYPYLLSPSDAAYPSGFILEVVETMNTNE